MRAQLDKEAQIRRRLQEVREAVWVALLARRPSPSEAGTLILVISLQLDGSLEAALGLLDTVVIRNPPGLTQYIPVLVRSFLPLLRSPLAAPRVRDPFLSLAGSVMPPRLKTLG